MFQEERLFTYQRYINQSVYPKELDERYGYLLANGYYNYQEYINYLAEKAQAGDSEALETCLYYFGWRGQGAPGELLADYYSLLTYGAVDIDRVDHLALLRLSQEDEREVLKGNRNSHKKANLAARKMGKVSNRLRYYKPKQEIFEDLVDLLIDRILKYKQGDRTLRKYVYDIFYLYVGDYVQRTFKQKDIHTSPYQRFDTDIENIGSEVSFPITHTSEDVLYEWEQSKEDLGVFWVNGHTHPVFQSLTRLERLILRDNYHYEIPERALAKKYGVSRDVIKRLKRQGKAKLQEALENQDIWLTEQEGYQTLEYPT